MKEKQIVKGWLEGQIPEFVKMCDEGEEENVIMSFDAFSDSPELFFTAVWYAGTGNKTVIVIPGSNKNS